jgi:hypothetical protein
MANDGLTAGKSAVLHKAASPSHNVLYLVAAPGRGNYHQLFRWACIGQFEKKVARKLIRHL